jgi:hypothetical protein
MGNFLSTWRHCSKYCFEVKLLCWPCFLGCLFDGAIVLVLMVSASMHFHQLVLEDYTKSRRCWLGTRGGTFYISIKYIKYLNYLIYYRSLRRNLLNRFSLNYNASFNDFIAQRLDYFCFRFSIKADAPPTDSK